MIRVLLLPALGQELAACAVLGVCTGTVRAFFPVRGRGAFVPDLLWVGTLLTLLQSYAAGQSSAGVLRWYMAASAFGAAGAASFVLGAPLRAAGTALLTPVRCRLKNCRRRCKSRRNAKRTAEKRKKNLPNRQRMLYNSNVLK